MARRKAGAFHGGYKHLAAEFGAGANLKSPRTSSQGILSFAKARREIQRCYGPSRGWP